jgi:peroxiredoxin
MAVDLSGKNNPRTFSLSKDSDNGLWSGTFTLNEGTYQLIFSAIDGASNKTTRNLNKVMVVTGGRISSSVDSSGVTSAKITVYYQEPVTNTWAVWDGGAYSQINPQITDGNGNYNLFLPPGKYYLHIEGFGFKTTDTEFFTIDSPQPINANFVLSPLKLLFSLGPIKIYLPDFSVLSVPFKNNVPSDSAQDSNDMIGKSTPFFNLAVSGQNTFSSDSLTGKPSVLTFINTWSPASTEQISILDRFAKNKDFNSTVIVEGEKVSKVYVFQQRGGYSLPVFADPDATLSIPYNLSSLPVHYFLDRKGVVKKVVYGALNEEELANILVNISQ